MKMAKLTPSDDTVREILLRIDDLPTLFRCAVTCKRWRRLVAKPSFLLGLRQNRWPPSLGFFSQCLRTRFPGTSPTDSSSQLAFSLLSGPSVLGTNPRSLSSFVHADGVGDVDVVPLTTHGGLLLLRLYPRHDDFEPNAIRLAVCDLLAGKWDVLPELDYNTQLRCTNPYSYGILPGSGPARTFRVLMISEDKEKPQFNLHVFVSGELTWRAPRKCFDMMEHQIWSVEQKEAVVCRGMVHWLFVSTSSNHFHILNVNAETGHVSLTKLLSPTKELHFVPNRFDGYRRAQRAFSVNCLITTDGGTNLSLCMYSGRQLEIWTRERNNRYLKGNDDAVWHLTAVIGRKLTELIQQLEQPSSILSGERSSTLLITDYHRERKYIADLDAGTLEEVTDQFRDHAWSTTMLVEIDWQAFFTLRLGGL